MVMDRLNSYNYIVFSSTNGVDSFFRALKNRGEDTRILAGKKMAAIGIITGDALTSYGITVDVVAKTFDAEGLVEEILLSGSVTGKKILLVRAAPKILKC